MPFALCDYVSQPVSGHRDEHPLALSRLGLQKRAGSYQWSAQGYAYNKT